MRQGGRLAVAAPFGKLRSGRRYAPGGAYRRPGPEVKERDLEMYTEGSSLSAIGRVLGYGAPAVLGRVKKGACRTEPTAGAQPAADRGPGRTPAGGGGCL